jgi:hypothetical protein
VLALAKAVSCLSRKLAICKQCLGQRLEYKKCTTYHISGCRELAPEVEAAVLSPVVGSDITESRVTNVANGKETKRVRSTGDRSDVVRQGKDRPVIGDGTEVVILGVGEDSFVDELSTSLVGGTVQLDVELAFRKGGIGHEAYVMSGKVRGSVYHDHKDLHREE